MYGPYAEDVFFYLTLYNEPYLQPAAPEDVDVDGIVRGMHLYAPAPDGLEGPRAQVLASGVAVPWALKAQALLRDDWGVHADVWSVTSWNELRRDGLEADSWNWLHPDEDARTPYVRERLMGRPGPVVAVSDYMRAVPDQIREWVDSDFASLGTDGFGLSDTRGALRRHFKVDAESITVRVLTSLAASGEVDADLPGKAIARYDLLDVRSADPGAGMGDA
jgi:pyruvate dehydrogenase E1 component